MIPDHQGSSLMMEAARTSETSVDNYFTRQYIPQDNSKFHASFDGLSMINSWTEVYASHYID
jgi:hypothetical protein